MIRNIINIGRNANLVPTMKLRPAIQSTEILSKPQNNKAVKGFNQSRFNRRMLEIPEHEFHTKNPAQESMLENNEEFGRKAKMVRRPWKRADKTKFAEYFDNFNQVYNKNTWIDSVVKELDAKDAKKLEAEAKNKKLYEAEAKKYNERHKSMSLDERYSYEKEKIEYLKYLRERDLKNWSDKTEMNKRNGLNETFEYINKHHN